MIPEGLCQCGCGRETKIAKQTKTRAGWVKGRPVPYVRGHGARSLPHHPSELLVDPEDAHLLDRQWTKDRESGYWRRTTPDGCRLLLHRVIMGRTFGDGVLVDHKNRNPSDNRRENLRLTTRLGNSQNVSADRGSTSRYRGVSWCAQTGRWKAQVRVDGTTRNLGRFDTEEEAFAVAQACRLKHMPFALD